MALNWRNHSFSYFLGLLLGIIALVSIPEQSKTFKYSRLPLTLIGFLSGCLLLYDGKLPNQKEIELTEKEQDLLDRETQKEIELKEKEQNLIEKQNLIQVKENQLYQERQALLIEHQKEVAEVETRLQKWVDEQVNNWQQQYKQQADMYEGIIANLKHQLLLANAPRRPYGNRPVDDHANKIINYLLERGIWVHCDVQPADTLSEEVFIFTLQNPEDVSKVKELTEQLECLLNVNGSISVKRDGRYLKITHYLRELSPEKKH